MKKSVIIFLLVFAFCFSACGKSDADKKEVKAQKTETYEILEEVTEDNKQQPEDETEVTTVALVGIEDEVEKLPLQHENMEFMFSSGAGGWRTVMYLNSDGTFSGIYTDSELGSTGEGYPNGTYYVSEFSGKFGNIKKVNDYTYSMEIADIELVNEPGEEWIDDDVLYIASDPYGIDGGKDFILYLPDAPVSEMSEEFLSWWPYRFDYNENPKTTISCYGIKNVSNDNGFFTYN